MHIVPEVGDKLKETNQAQTRVFADFCANLPLYMGKMGSICHFSLALPASIWGDSSQVLVFTSDWSTQEGCDNDTFRAVLPCICMSWEPATLQNK